MRACSSSVMSREMPKVPMMLPLLGECVLGAFLRCDIPENSLHADHLAAGIVDSCFQHMHIRHLATGILVFLHVLVHDPCFDDLAIVLAVLIGQFPWVKVVVG